jgi:hypothetical protein
MLRRLPLTALLGVFGLGCGSGPAGHEATASEPSASSPPPAEDAGSGPEGAPQKATLATSDLHTSKAGMSVVGNQLMRDGAPFRARGFNMIGALTPAWCSEGSGETARAHFGASELGTAITTWDANIIRLQVSQRGLEDPALTSTEISDYLSEITTDVATATGLGLVVILSMQDQSIGCGPVHPMPSAQTVAAWKTLVPAFANAADVMFELFNEPENDVTAAAWAQWRNGGTGPTSNLGDPVVGFQTLVDDIRGWGADNVLLADGALHAEHLDGVSPYLLSDTTAGLGIAYAIHPYYFSPGATYWQTTYGFLAPTQAIVATEWDYLAADCGTTAETLAPSFLTWLEQSGIGMTAHAFDVLATQIANWSYTPTACGTSTGGSGKDLMSWYAHLDQPPKAPGSLTTTATATSLSVSWPASTGAFAIAGYDVYLDGTLIGTTTALDATFGALACGTSHTVGVDALDAMGNHSTETRETSETTGCLAITALSASPQPLTKKTTIAFTLSESAEVSIDIETTAGTIVKHKMTNQALAAGESSVDYSGYDDANDRLSSGSYLVVVTATDSSLASTKAQITLQVD